MQILTNSELQDAVRKVRPWRVAVAYVGVDWQRYVDDKSLKEIIVSPTLGSNPRAIWELAARFGWANLHFLDRLHAKFYIGTKEAVVGSLNLSNNGFCEDGLEEIGAIVDQSEDLKKLNSEFERLKRLASEQYSTEQAKIERLIKLEGDFRTAVAEGLAQDRRVRVDFDRYAPSESDRIYISWWRNETVTKDFSVIASQEPSLREETFDEVVADWTTLMEDDDIAPGSWLLLWNVRRDGRPGTKWKPRWLYVHQLISEAITDDVYTKMAVQRKDKCCPVEPFRLDSPHFLAEFNRAICLPEFASLRDNEEGYWYASAAKIDSMRLLDSIRQAPKVVDAEQATE